jgi:RNA polymerase sigma-70 factor (ECF subfamily)
VKQGLQPDQQRVADLYRTFGPVIYRRALRLLSSKAAAQDATQEVFLKMLRRLEEVREVEKALPWIYAVTTNHCLSVLRNEGRREALAEPLPVAARAAEQFPERQLVHQVLARFDTTTQAVAVSVLVDGMEHGEVATALGVSAKTVSRKLQRFLVNARKFLQRTDA